MCGRDLSSRCLAIHGVEDQAHYAAPHKGMAVCLVRIEGIIDCVVRSPSRDLGGGCQQPASSSLIRPLPPHEPIGSLDEVKLS